ncbi:HlyD family secretion protein [Pedobacter alpinus]|uniref:HlyD family secretion protein n=1 Tax=Pedobacter alpinus TaxID=1590643 RepID=A0ABW5TNV2_9SPHI
MFLQSKTHTDKLMKFGSFGKMMISKPSNILFKVFLWLLGFATIVLLLPWTQNVQSIGTVSSISPNQRPQQINSIIPGRIIKWYIRDGQRVNKGDTLLQISEIKEEYLDESLLERVDEQINAKGEAVEFYKQKAGTANQQEDALVSALGFKMDQLRNKLGQYILTVQSDSMAYNAAISQLKISTEQQIRQQQLYDAGLKSLTELEQKQQYYQDALSKKISAENKYFNSKNELLNIKLDLFGAEQEYGEKISKVNGERFTALSQVSSTEGEIAKLKNQFQNYKQRQSFYTIIAPQSGQVVQTVKAGLGETVKDGETLMQIVPDDFDAAVEIAISPLNMPLMSIGQKVQLQFDGFPAIVFSGWPDASYGVFDGKVKAIDQSTDLNGNFKVWVVPNGGKAWPKELRFGAGAKSIALLKDVPLIYELWRQLNGFPPEYYQQTSGVSDTKKKK